MLSRAKFFWWCGALFISAGLVRAGENDVAIAIVYDTSGSMSDPVKSRTGKGEPKYLVASRALGAIVTRLEKFATAGGRSLQTGLFTFRDKASQESVKMGPFDPAALRSWLATFNRPAGGTPLGTTIAEAGGVLAKMKAGSRHVLVVTDGENTIGPAPEMVLPGLLDAGVKTSRPIYFHFVAFDVDARIFAGVKKLGVTLVGASDETQLNDKLGFILEEKILLEKE